MTNEQQRYGGKVAVVTGGASGIGEGIVRRLVAEGARVVVTDMNAEAVERSVAEHGGAVVGVVGDVSRRETNVEMVERAVAEFGGLDAAFNVAGTNRLGSILEQDEADWDVTVDVCLKGTFLGMQQQARQMVAQGRGGAIVNIASLNAVMPNHGSAAYCSSKAAITMLGQVGALELGEHKIRVNAVSPGLTDTPLARPLIDTTEVYQDFLANIPLREHGTPADMAAAALFLASDDARYITGTNLLVDGGWATAGYPDLRPFLAKLSAEIGHDELEDR